MTRRLWIIAVSLAIGTGGCTSAALRYHTLLAPAQIRSPGGDPEAVTLDVRVAHLPAIVSRRELIIRTGPSEMTLLESDRWASPLTDEIADSVRMELHTRLSRVSTASHLSGAGKLLVSLDFEAFEAAPGRYAAIVGSWSARFVGGKHDRGYPGVADRPFSYYQAVGADYSEMVGGYQRELGQLAEAIVDSLGSAADSP